MGNELLLYWSTFLLSTSLCGILQAYGRVKSSARGPAPAIAKTLLSKHLNSLQFDDFQANYLLIYLLAMFSDWLQGPYIYELYVSYGFKKQEIAELFVCGFGSSMIFGTFIGGLADSMGRKRACILYSVCYILACITKLFPIYSYLMLGRFLSGVSTSLLFSVFESWMVCEHNKRGFDELSLGKTFAIATFGNGAVGVVGGLVANTTAEMYGYVAPFVFAIAPLMMCGLLVHSSWSENYGSESSSIAHSFVTGFKMLRNDPSIAALGLSQSLFEGSMYTFIFMWTPALHSSSTAKPHSHVDSKESDPISKYLGLIFAVFMMSSMVGSSIFQLYSDKKEIVYNLPILIHVAAMIAMITVAVCLEEKATVYSMFLVFEVAIGLFYPCFGLIKSEMIPEESRSALMNIFRIPLNAFVIILLFRIDSLSFEAIFLVCAGAHLAGLLFYLYFYYCNVLNPKKSLFVESKILLIL